MKWIALGFVLTSCTSVQYVPCPTVIAYSNTDQMELANEINDNPRQQIVRWLGDYIGLRDQVRACRGR